jgi:bifunctional UDP-N-acetylglucosamine pyrophosphorylase/glucosamine-1-phosphate N-acetyltransferase
MLPVAGRPILEHLLVECRAAGLSDFIFVVGFREEIIRNYFNDGCSWGVRIRYVSQRHPLGTADALRQAGPWLHAPFVLINGDVVVNAEDIRLLKEMAPPAISLVECDDVTGMGVAEVSGCRVVKLHEKPAVPPTRLVNAGIYHLSSNVLATAANTGTSSRGEYEITATLQLLIDSGVEVGYRMINTWRDIGNPWELLSANEDYLSTIESYSEGKLEPGSMITGPVSIGRDSLIRSGCYITGPVIIGANCDIGPNCYIRPATTIGDHCRLGAAVEIKNSVIMSGTHIPHLSYVGDSVIGERCNLGAGTNVANVRLDGQMVITGRGGRRKAGVIMGDKVQTGINSSINPGTIIGCEAVIGPGAVVAGNIGAGARVF